MKNENKYEPNKIEAKWQSKWESDKTYSPNIEAVSSSASHLPRRDKPFYNLMMFPYPSAEGLHVGNMYAFTGADVYGRFKRMQGSEVFEPIGLDGFGIHSENYALKVGRHPLEQSKLAEKNFYRQLRSIGNSFDMERTVETYDPEYYKWTQWLFIQLFKAGLAYRKKAEVNWCPSCLTVLSDEQVIDDKCERCSSEVEKKQLEQWFFRITDYAQRLLDNIDSLDWTEKVKIAQRNWIGRSEGAEIEFEIVGSQEKLNVFTTRPDTLHGATFMVVSPEHELVNVILNSFQNLEIPKQVRDDVSKYVDEAKNKTDIERTAEGKEKTGVFSGLYAINPVNGKKIPVWVADYVLSSYGTGAIMAVPAHDQRDLEFANKYDLEIIPVIKEKEESKSSVKIEKALSGQGIIMGSENWDGFHVPNDILKVVADLEARNIGKRRVNFHLRDWLISRQRYWGPPIPMIYCESCASQGKSWFNSSHSEQSEESLDRSAKLQDDSMVGWYPVSEDQLPVLLPDVADWKPEGTGKSPLANHPEFYKTKCPECGSDATRETDVSDTFLDSAWYFLRYPNTDIATIPFDTERIKKWLPVNMYIGGAEHSVLHLLYSRFITMALKDLGHLDFEEPFSKFYAHGLIIKDGAKMSKSKGNVVVPDEYINKYGADSLRTYLMFLGPYSDGGDFRDSGIEGIFKYLKRVWKLLNQNESTDLNHEKSQAMHKTIKKVTDDLSNLRYNTAIAGLMEWYNEIVKSGEITKVEKEAYIKLIAPFAPHMAEELWQELHVTASKSEAVSEIALSQAPRNDNFQSVHKEKWPQFDTSMLVSDTFTIVIQVNGKRRGEISISNEQLTKNQEVEDMAKDAVKKHLEGSEIRKTIYVKGKIVNFVI